MLDNSIPINVQELGAPSGLSEQPPLYQQELPADESNLDLEDQQPQDAEDDNNAMAAELVDNEVIVSNNSKADSPFEPDNSPMNNMGDDGESSDYFIGAEGGGGAGRYSSMAD